MAGQNYFHAIATLPGGRRKSIVNKTEEQMLTGYVIPFVSNGVIQEKWGSKLRSYQVLELRVFATSSAWHKASGTKLEKHIGKAQNRYKTLEKRAKKAISVPAHRVFIVMPIQGDEYGTQDDQRISEEFDRRFETIERLLGGHESVAIRIDKEHTLDELVKRIKEEIKRAQFVIADLTDERPSCYFEVGFAEALKKPVIYIASKESVVNPKSKTKIHFDIHRNVNYFVNHKQLKEKLNAAITKNKESLFPKKAD